jgi:NADPH:quinone reductase-like Zn-dependent oxidoreductase
VDLVHVGLGPGLHVPHHLLDLGAAGTVPLDGLAALQVVDLLGEAPDDDARLLVTGAAGAVGANVLVLAAERGWRVTGLARRGDEGLVRGLGAGFTTDPEPGWDAVADAAVLQDEALVLVRDGGAYVGVSPATPAVPERGIAVATVVTRPDDDRLADLLARAAVGRLPTRVHAVLPLERAVDAHRAVAGGGLRGRVVLVP